MMSLVVYQESCQVSLSKTKTADRSGKMPLPMVLNYLDLATKKEHSPLGVPAELRTHYLQSPLHSSKHKLSMSSFHRAVQLELLLWEQAHQKKKIRLKE